jgi:colanic acid biosynthesis glycosyl transferase WcaI
MKILFLTDNFPPEVNAAASRVYERACYWAQDKNQVSVLTCAPNFPLGKVYEGYTNKWVQKEVMKGIQVTRVKTFMAPNRGFALRILDFLSFMVMAIIVGTFQQRPDVIIATSPQFFTAVAGWALSKIKRVPFIFEISDLWPESIKGLGLLGDSFIFKLLEKVELFLYRQAALIVAQTPAFKENLVSRGINPSKIKVILNGVEVNNYAPAAKKDETLLHKYHLENKFIVGYIGTHGLSQNLKSVIDCAKIVEGKAKDILFLFVGDGAEREEIIQHANTLGVKNVLFIPLQPKSEIKKWWSVCDISLVTLKNLPIFKTIIPSKIFESFGMGLPVFLVSPEGEASQLITKENLGVHVNPEDITVFADELIKLAKDKSKLQDLSRASVEASKKYSREKQAREFIDFIGKKINSVGAV